jgi:hypothetical protein
VKLHFSLVLKTAGYFLLSMPIVALGGCGEREIQRPAPPDFSGFWEHAIAHFLPADEGPGPVVNMPGLTFAAMNIWVGDYRNPILQVWASEAVRLHDIAELERGEPLLGQLQLCMAFGVPRVLTLREPVQFLQEPDMVTIVHQHDNQVRRIYLDEAHASNPTPSPYGHSVGHYEGDELVVDTLAMSDSGPIDFYGTPHTNALHVVERYRLSQDGHVLEVRFTVSDPGTFTSEWKAVQRYYRIPLPGGFRENICAENIRDGLGGEYPVPMDDTPDF